MNKLVTVIVTSLVSLLIGIVTPLVLLVCFRPEWTVQRAWKQMVLLAQNIRDFSSYRVWGFIMVLCAVGGALTIPILGWALCIGIGTVMLFPSEKDEEETEESLLDEAADALARGKGKQARRAALRAAQVASKRVFRSFSAYKAEMEKKEAPAKDEESKDETLASTPGKIQASKKSS